MSYIYGTQLILYLQYREGAKTADMCLLKEAAKKLFSYGSAIKRGGGNGLAIKENIFEGEGTFFLVFT